MYSGVEGKEKGGRGEGGKGKGGERSTHTTHKKMKIRRIPKGRVKTEEGPASYIHHLIDKDFLPAFITYTIQDQDQL